MIPRYAKKFSFTNEEFFSKQAEDKRLKELFDSMQALGRKMAKEAHERTEKVFMKVLRGEVK